MSGPWFRVICGAGNHDVLDDIAERHANRQAEVQAAQKAFFNLDSIDVHSVSVSRV